MKKILLIILLNIVFMQVVTDLTFQTSKSISMAGAVVSDPEAAESIFINPAGLSSAVQSELFIGSTNYYGLDFINYYYLSGVYANPYGNLGISYQTLEVSSSASDISLLSESSLSFSQGFSLLNDRNSTLDIGYSFNIFSLKQAASAGVTGDGSDGLPGNQIYSYGIDLGVLSSLRDKVKLGAFIKNINSPSIGKGSSLQYLPRKLTIGISYIPNKNLRTHFNLERLLGHEDLHFRFGFEYIFNEIFSLRSGIQMKPNCFGFGFKYSPIDIINLSFGIIAGPVMPTTQNLELSVKFK